MMDMDYAQKMRKCNKYVEALEDERRKILVFQRELPLCLELVTQVIEACKKETSATRDYMQGQSDCSEQTTSDVPVLEEFLPIKRSSDHCSEEEDQDDEHDSDKNSKQKNVPVPVPAAVDNTKKSDWLRSVQLWNNNQSEVKKTGGAFQSFHKEKISVKTNNGSATSTSTTESGSKGEAINGNSSKKEGNQSRRKQRRCWSPELQRRFLYAVQQLGGSHVATPKQIRELMKVDGLTNDEVKSHLQKYRLHTRRPSSTTNPQPPQFVVVGGIWMPPPEYAITNTATVTPTSGTYTPVAVPLPTLSQQSQSEERGYSPSTSSST